MSRCFPFPPPGYEKKPKTDDTDILTKEKHKERKHKKDKKDKEKREHKEKKDKERSIEKHREGKDRKEKHKDNKDGDRDREKFKASDERRIEGHPERYNGEKLGPNSLLRIVTKDSKFLQELGRRIADKDGAGNQMVQKITVTGQRRTELPGRVAESNVGNWAHGKENSEDKNEDGTKANRQRNKVKAKDLEDAIVHSFFGVDQKRVDEVAKTMEKKDVEKQLEGKEKKKHKESDRGDEQKDRDREKKSKSKDKDKDKKKEKEEKVKEKREKNKALAKLIDGSKDSLDIPNMKPSHLLNEGNKSSASEGNLGKRKELEINEFLHDNNIQPNKLLRPVSSSHPVLENGRKLEPCQTAIQFAYEKQGAAISHKVGTKKHKSNGMIQAQLSNVCSTQPLSATVQANENGEASAKPPHPDSKYLSRILSVPKMEWSDFDDQEWLFSSSSLKSKNPIVSSSRDQGTPLVWAEAIQIESANVSVLPYVIPY